MRRLLYKWRRRIRLGIWVLTLDFSRCLYYYEFDDGFGIGNVCGIYDILIPYNEARWR